MSFALLRWRGGYWSQYIYIWLETKVDRKSTPPHQVHAMIIFCRKHVGKPYICKQLFRISVNQSYLRNVGVFGQEFSYRQYFTFHTCLLLPLNYKGECFKLNPLLSDVESSYMVG